MSTVGWAPGEGPVAAYAAGYQGELEQRGFSPRAVRDRMEVAGQLNRWLAAEGLSAADLAVDRAVQFFSALRAAGQRRVPAMSTLAPLFAYLRCQQVLPPEQVTATPTEELLGSYRRYLVQERGVAPLTVLRYERMARRFLLGRLSRAGGLTGVEDLGGAEVIAGEQHLRVVLSEYISHYNTGRSHQGDGMKLRAPNDAPDVIAFPGSATGIQRRARLAGLINEYRQAA